MIGEPLSVLIHAEEVVALLAFLRHQVVVRTLAVNDFAIGEKALTADAVKPFVFAEVDVPLIIDLLQDGGDDVHVTCLGRTDEIVVADAQCLPRPDVAFGNAIDEYLGFHARLVGGGEDLFPVLVGPRQQVRVIAVEPVVTGQHVSDDGRVGVSEGGLSGDVVDGCGEIGDTTHRWLSFMRAGRFLPARVW